jgi:sugar phosphate permease
MKEVIANTKPVTAVGHEPAVVPATHVRYQVLAAACTLAVLTYVHRLGFTAGLPAIKEDLCLNDEEVGYLTSAFLVAYGLFQVPGGLLGDRLGGRHVLTLLVLCWSLLTGAVALAVGLPAVAWLPFVFLLVLRFLFGMAQAGGFPVLARVLADWMPAQQRGFAQGLVWTFSRLGGALVPFLFLWLFKVFGGWTTPFWDMAFLGLIWCAAFWPWFRNRPGEMRQVNAAERELIASGRSTAAAPPGPFPLRRALTSPSVWGLCLMYGFIGFAGNFFTALQTVYVRDHKKVSDELTQVVFGLTMAAGVISCVLGGVVSDWLVRSTGSRKWGRRLNGSVGLALGAFTFLCIIWAQDAWQLALLFSLTFFLNDASMGPAWASCADIGERHAGTLSGAMNMIGAFAGAGGMAMAGAFFRRGWDVPVFIIFACSYALASLCWMAVDATKPLVPRGG